MKTAIGLQLVVGMLVISLPLVGSASEAKGILEINGDTIELHHVLAYSVSNSEDSNKTDIIVVLTDKPLPEGKARPDVEEGIQGIVLVIEENGTVRSMWAYHRVLPQGTYWALVGSTPIKFEASEGSKNEIAGRAHAPRAPEEYMNNTLNRFDATFRTALGERPMPPPTPAEPEKIPFPTASANPLPADGGEPGKAFRNLAKAVYAGDLKKVKGLMAAHLVDDLQSPDDLEFVKMMIPENVNFTEALIAEDRAKLVYELEIFGQMKSVSAEFVRQGKNWLLTNID